MQSRSSSVKLISSVVKKPLLRMLRWLRVAPLGRPVVPEVYWMLIGSSGVRPSSPVSLQQRHARVVTLWSVHSGLPRNHTCSGPVQSPRTSSTIPR